MKRLYATLIVLIVSCGLYGQSANDKLIQFAKEGIKDAKEISYSASPSILHVDEYLIPVAESTNVTVGKEKGTYFVWFALQNGTAVTSTKDPQWRRASFQLTFKSKQGAQNFAKAFKKAASNQ